VSDLVINSHHAEDVLKPEIIKIENVPAAIFSQVPKRPVRSSRAKNPTYSRNAQNDFVFGRFTTKDFIKQEQSLPRLEKHTEQKIPNHNVIDNDFLRSKRLERFGKSSSHIDDQQMEHENAAIIIPDEEQQLDESEHFIPQDITARNTNNEDIESYDSDNDYLGLIESIKPITSEEESSAVSIIKFVLNRLTIQKDLTHGEMYTNAIDMGENHEAWLARIRQKNREPKMRLGRKSCNTLTTLTSSQNHESSSDDISKTPDLVRMFNVCKTIKKKVSQQISENNKS
jgi:hypothetical protein